METVSKAKTTIKECSCSNSYQDTKYGKQRRVMNVTKAGDYRCTVCAKVHKGT